MDTLCSYLLLVVLACGAVTSTSALGIIGGNTAFPNQFPFVVSLQLFDGTYHWCGGAIIDKSWILTAAQCLAWISAEDVTIIAGTNSIGTTTTTGLRYNISKIVVHQNFTGNRYPFQDDIALAQINGEFTISDSVQIVSINDVADGVNATVIGWGATRNEDTSTDLLYATASVLSQDECVEKSKGGEYVYRLQEGQVCALADAGVGPCNGDSGGPLVVGEELVGLVAYGVTPCARGYPDVYTRVGVYEDWIKNNKK